MANLEQIMEIDKIIDFKATKVTASYFVLFQTYNLRSECC